MTARDTVFALSSGAGMAAVAVVRLSGPGAGAALERLTGRTLPPPRRARLSTLADPTSGEMLDRALVLWFPAPGSYTGEDMAELHLHGGRAVIRGVLEILARLPGLRPAEPGEFTRRAFENGRFDLAEAEGIADLVAAETAFQRRQATRQMTGELSRYYEGLRERLVRILGHLEAYLDFPEEGLPESMTRDILLSVEGLITDINQHLSDNRRGQRLREGAYVALVGPPNVGKSTLLNLLARREAAIVAATAGTTRDVIEVHLDLSGLPVTVADTAGLREAAGDEIEAEGVRRARERAERADLRVLVADATAPGEAAALLALWPDGTRAVGTLVVANKCDLLAGAPPPREIGGLPALAVSLRTGLGVGSLLAAIEDRVRDLLGDGSGLYLTRERHRQALEGCRDALARAVAGLKVAAPPELAAEDLRLAVRALGRITGRVDVEELLDVIFRDFCIGK